MNLDVKILYLSLYNLIKKKYGTNVLISRKEIYCELGRHFLIPKNLRYAVIKELEQLQLLKIENREQVLLINHDLCLEADVNQILKRVGLF